MIWQLMGCTTSNFSGPGEAGSMKRRWQLACRRSAEHFELQLAAKNCFDCFALRKTNRVLANSATPWGGSALANPAVSHFSTQRGQLSWLIVMPCVVT